ncbi:MAG: 30S ribosomal protein S2 [Planctomycetota bacterium]|nr:30S ribosomal protein S2 [Planctomycetota bacterium]
MPIVSAKDLLAAGAHFGHSSSRWNPKMEPYILCKRNRIHIINLRETVRGVVGAWYYVRKTVSEGGQLLFVGTKRQAQEVVTLKAQDCEMPFVTERWLGGTLTNLLTIKERVKRLIELETMEEDGSLNAFSKKMRSALNREQRKIKRNLDGIRNMQDLPGAIFVVDPKHDHNAVAEARTLGIPVIAMLDTDADPDNIDIPIPANDDAMRSIECIAGKMAEAVKEGVNLRKAHPELAKRRQEAERRQIEQQQSVGAVSVGGRIR